MDRWLDANRLTDEWISPRNGNLFQSSHKETQNYRHENYKDLWLLFVNARVVIYAAHLLTEHKVPCKYSAISLMGQEPMWFSKDWAHSSLLFSPSLSHRSLVGRLRTNVCVLSELFFFFIFIFIHFILMWRLLLLNLQKGILQTAHHIIYGIDFLLHFWLSLALVFNESIYTSIPMFRNVNVLNGNGDFLKLKNQDFIPASFTLSLNWSFKRFCATKCCRSLSHSSSPLTWIVQVKTI